MEDVDFLDTLVAFPLLVVGHAMVLNRLIKHTLVHQGRVPTLWADHKGRDIRDAHLESQQDKIRLEPDVFTPGQHLVLWNIDIDIGQQLVHFLNANLDVANHFHELAERLAILDRQFFREGTRIGQHEIGNIGNMLAVTIPQEKTVIQFLGLTDRRGDAARTIPGDIIEFDRLLGRAKAVATYLQRIEDRGIPNSVTDHLVETSTIRMSNPLLLGLNR